MKRCIQGGLTLIEILFACFIFLLCTGLLAGTFSGLARTYFQGNTKMEQQNQMRTVLDMMASELRECYNLDQASPDPAVVLNGGRTIEFKKYDNRKKLLVEVRYHYLDNEPGRPIRRRDFDGATQLSECMIGEGFSNVQFGIAPASGIIKTITIEVSALDANNHTMTLKTAVTPRTGMELLAVKAIGKKEPHGASSCWKAGP